MVSNPGTSLPASAADGLGPSLDGPARRRVGELVEAARWLGGRGFLPATSGNLSVRLDDGRLALTASGRDKAALTEADLLLLDPAGRPLPAGPGTGAPSAEAALHLRLYRRFPACRAVLHVHSPASTALSRRAAAAGRAVVELAGYELLKALAGVTTHEHVEPVPLVENSQDLDRLGAAADRALDAYPSAHAYLIASHGLYTWGASVAEARRQVEALELLFDCELLLQGPR